jgi:beta-N-acetylhexosaminidase
MCGHLSFPNVVGNNEPATISKYFQTELLRGRLGFNGVSITDDLLMRGVTLTGYSIEEISAKALEAGNDMILVSRGAGTHRRIWQHLHDKMESDTSFRDRVYQAASRVLTTKLSYLQDDNGVPFFPDPEKISESIPHPEGEKFFFDLACRSVSVYRDTDIPIDTTHMGKLLLTGQFYTFIREGKKRFPDADSYYFPYDPFYAAEPGYIARLRTLVPQYDTLVYCLANPNSQQVLRALKDICIEEEVNLIVFSVLTPIYLSEFPWVESALAVYGFGEESFKAGFAVLAGDFVPEGKIPIELDAQRIE